MVETAITSINITTWQFLVITQIIIFLLGWPLEWTEILIIFVPIFLPLLEIFWINHPAVFTEKKSKNRFSIKFLINKV